MLYKKLKIFVSFFFHLTASFLIFNFQFFAVLSVRVLETRNIVGNEIFPDSNIEQWQISDDSIELPKGALIENSEGGLVRIVFVAFDRLESILRPVNIWNDARYNLNSGKFIYISFNQSYFL